MSFDPSNAPALLKPAEAAALLRVEVATLSTWRCRSPERIPFVRVGGRAIRYRLSDLLRIIGSADAACSGPALS
ncbi:MAG: helix-turn-helix domain-containing protein [Gemmatimonadales bacterium]